MLASDMTCGVPAHLQGSPRGQLVIFEYNWASSSTDAEAAVIGSAAVL